MEPIQKAAMPKAVKPMLCTLRKEPFTDPKSLYEVNGTIE
jgi:hypothetical protein